MTEGGSFDETLIRCVEYTGSKFIMIIDEWDVTIRETPEGNAYLPRVFVLMGDAELNEGSIWEAFMSASHYKLDNLIAIIDRNHLSYDGDTEDVMAIEPLEDKLKAFPSWRAYRPIITLRSRKSSMSRRRLRSWLCRDEGCHSLHEESVRSVWA